MSELHMRYTLPPRHFWYLSTDEFGYVYLAIQRASTRRNFLGIKRTDYAVILERNVVLSGAHDLQEAVDLTASKMVHKLGFMPDVEENLGRIETDEQSTG